MGIGAERARLRETHWKQCQFLAYVVDPPQLSQDDCVTGTVLVTKHGSSQRELQVRITLAAGGNAATTHDFSISSSAPSTVGAPP